VAKKRGCFFKHRCTCGSLCVPWLRAIDRLNLALFILHLIKRFNAETGANIDAKALGIYACALGARERHRSDTIEFVLDRMEDGHGKIARARRYAETDLYYPFMQDCPNLRVMAQDDPNGSQNTPALQAADALAWELRKNYELKRPWFEGGDTSPDSPGMGKQYL
jgi:hypothetical protein